jgi:Fur family transcriptional regulator, ferric uptake regulator
VTFCQRTQQYINESRHAIVDRYCALGLLLQLGAIRMSCFATLKEKGLRLTLPRRVILDYIHDKGDHLTAEEIINYVHDSLPRVNKSTIYRTLDLLEKHECVFKSESVGRVLYHHAEGGHHYHLVCSRCGKTIDCEQGLFAPMARSLGKKYGFSIDFKHVVMSGLCKRCKSLPG